MNRLKKAFADNRANGVKGFIPYFTAGYPTIDGSVDLIRAAADAGSTAIEVGVPFSDPIADGPVIQHSSQVALENGVTLPRILDMVAEIRKHTGCPLVLMGYANTFMRRGWSAFPAQAAEAGVDGLIIPDLPPEEAGVLIENARAANVCTVFLAAPTSVPERLGVIAESTTGFLYYVARLGVTGNVGELAPELAAKIAGLREVTDLPIGAGFGVSDAEQVRAVVEHADAAIMGSRLIRMVGEHGGSEPVASAVGRFVAECVTACR